MMNTGGMLWKFKRENENRVFHDKLEINPAKLDNFPEDFEAYYNDNFPFRNPLLKAFHKIKFSVFHVSSDEENVIIGKDGWYFLGGSEKDNYEGRGNFSEHELELFTTLWNERLAYLSSKNIKTYWLICPTKHHIYSDKLPENVKNPFGETRTELLKKHLRKTSPGLVLDPTEFLKNQRKYYKLYFQLDNHWNQRAGNLITRYVIENMQKDFPKLQTDFLNDYTWKDTIKRDGIHKAALGIKELFEENEIARPRHSFAKEIDLYGFKAPKEFVYPWDYEKRYANAKSGNYRILVIRDSFGDDIIPFMKEAFQESVFIFDNWKYKMDKEIIENVKPDIVLYISMETHVENFIAN
jgi:hypothetical protein